MGDLTAIKCVEQLKLSMIRAADKIADFPHAYNKARNTIINQSINKFDLFTRPAVPSRDIQPA